MGSEANGGRRSGGTPAPPRSERRNDPVGTPVGPGPSTDEEDPRKRPRRRGDALNAAIFEAVLAELDEVGYAKLAMERVAERARTGKASLYRRWPNRARLVMEAMYHVVPRYMDPDDTGSLRGDLLELFRGVARLLEGPTGEAMRGVLGEVLHDEEVAEQIRSGSRGQSMAMIRRVADRAVARGEISPEALTPRRLEAGHALMRHHFLFQGGPITDQVIEEVVDEVVLPLFHLPPPD
ncbi:TetR/AcrR family transcriptional regulator [Nocardiopsis sp. RSe5-2]|uniref:TetR/AcrR family transcriptional regulator n=1 Tax=Nocardiopsis endophytica TaxID=3018445 RepID=A0ABT4U3Q8_9ACTN|nr:TetR/AcrR family transcriptional regulator [Nocardiopsis endophytica]MDA2811588.1 TetR/AcrR family transcriptional regulator [Nocardiopsis endophytica]